MIPDQYLDRDACLPHDWPSTTDAGGLGDVRMFGRGLGIQSDLHDLLFSQAKRAFGAQNAVFISNFKNYRCTLAIPSILHKILISLYHI